MSLVGKAAEGCLVGRPEALFFVDDDESELRIGDVLGRDRGGPDDHRNRAIRQARLHPLAITGVGQSRERGHLETGSLESLGEDLEVLAHQHGRRRGNHDLPACECSQRRGAQGDLGLAVSDIADHQPVHRAAGAKIFLDRNDRPRLVGRLGEREAGGKVVVQRSIGRDLYGAPLRIFLGEAG